jgi:predicted P-loop ATPase
MPHVTALPLAPNTDNMRGHLAFLFGDAREFDDGLIEIAVRTAHGWQSRLFGTDEINAAAAWAAQENAKGSNVYVGAALRDPDAPPFGRASDADHYATTAAYVDLDESDAANAAAARTGACKPDFVVCTGVHPHRRLQLWWKLDEPVSTPDRHRVLMEGLADTLGGDRTVCNPSRIMRLAGSIAWPMKPGRVEEMTFVVPLKYQPSRHTAEAVAAAYPKDPKVTSIDLTLKNDPIDRIGGKNSLGLDTGVLTDGRERYMRDTIMAVFIEYVGTHGCEPDAQELFDLVWPQYSAKVDLTREGRGADEVAKKCAQLLRRFSAGRLRGLPDIDAVAARYKAKRAERKAQVEEKTLSPVTGNEPAGLILNSKGNPYWCISNAIYIIRTHEDWRDVLAFNEFTGRSVVLRALPGTSPVNAKYPRDIQDADYTAATVWFNNCGFPSATKTVAADAVEMAANDAVFHPVRAYLNNLKWDGTPRLRTWLQVYCGATVHSEAHANYIQEAGFRWAISAVARIFTPGCKADSAIILEGRQGCGKSRGLKALAGEEFFGDSLPPMTSKDASTYLRGLWIIELAELSNINKAEVEHIKAFITRTEERFRPPYGRNEITFPRQCVFAGTTNRDDYLRDDTGNRRFWPIEVTDMDVDAITEDRDQIWAEAVHNFRAKETWHLGMETLEVAEEQQISRQSDDPWGDAIGEFVRNRRSVSASMIAVECLGIDIGKVNRADQNRIVSVLRMLGWKKAGRITTGRDYKGQSRYERGEE